MCMIIATGLMFAQKPFSFGPKIGVDYTHRWGNNVNDESALNYQAGAFFEYRFNNRISIAPELVFASHSTPKREIVDWIDIDPPIDITRTEQINYIDIPILLKYYFTSSLSVDLGPQFGICVYDKYTEKWKDDGKYKKTKHDLGANSFDFGVGIGLKYLTIVKIRMVMLKLLSVAGFNLTGVR